MVEHPIGNGEVVSSILTGSTSAPADVMRCSAPVQLATLADMADQSNPGEFLVVDRVGPGANCDEFFFDGEKLLLERPP